MYHTNNILIKVLIYIDIMLNFNHERFIAAVMSNRMARVCLEDAFNYAKQRTAFGKTLIEQPV